MSLKELFNAKVRSRKQLVVSCDSPKPCRKPVTEQVGVQIGVPFNLNSVQMGVQTGVEANILEHTNSKIKGQIKINNTLSNKIIESGEPKKLSQVLEGAAESLDNNLREEDERGETLDRVDTPKVETYSKLPCTKSCHFGCIPQHIRDSRRLMFLFIS